MTSEIKQSLLDRARELHTSPGWSLGTRALISPIQGKSQELAFGVLTQKGSKALGALTVG